MFCGYLTTTHQGLLARVNGAAPFGGIPALVWMGGNDRIITNGMSREQAAAFASPTVVTSQYAGHVVPGTSDATFDQVQAFFAEQATGSAGP